MALWDRGGKMLRTLPVAGYAWVEFTPDSRRLVVGDKGAYTFYEVGTWRQLHSLRRVSNMPGPMAFSPDGRMMAVNPSNLEVRLVDPATGKEVATLEAPQRKLVSSFAFSPDGRYLGVSTEANAVLLWDLRAVWEQLAEMGLDRDLPALPTPASKAGPGPVQVRLLERKGPP